jgi:hypothetical protein
LTLLRGRDMFSIPTRGRSGIVGVSGSLIQTGKPNF